MVDSHKIVIATQQSGYSILVMVKDSGVGVKDMIYDPFFTTKEVGKGSGRGSGIASPNPSFI